VLEASKMLKLMAVMHEQDASVLSAAALIELARAGLLAALFLRAALRSMA
jgi:hypothetical protein